MTWYEKVEMVALLNLNNYEDAVSYISKKRSG